MKRRGIDSHRWNRAWAKMRADESRARRRCTGAVDAAVVVYPRMDGGVDEWRGQLPFPALMRDRMRKNLDARV